MIGADAFLMKGEETAPFTEWAGNPATEIRPAAPVGDDAPTVSMPAADIQRAAPHGEDTQTTPIPSTPAEIPRAA